MIAFRIKSSSLINYIITWFIVIILTCLIWIKLFPDNIVIKIVFVIIALLIIRYTTPFTANGLTEWKFDREEIHIQWLKQIIFHKRTDITIKWDDIKAYKLSSSKVFDMFKLVLKKGKPIRIYHDSLISKDDFDSFISYFIDQVEQHNKREEKN